MLVIVLTCNINDVNLKMVCFVFRGDSQVCSEDNGLERLDIVSFEEPLTGNQLLHMDFIYECTMR